MERIDAGEHFVKGDPDGEDVGALVQPLRQRLLRAHVDELPFDHPGFGFDRAQLRLRDSEVDDLHVAAVRNEDVLRVEIAMHQVQRSAGHVGQVVRVGSPVADLLRQAAAQLGGNLLLPPHRGVDQVAQRFALHVFHGDEISAGLLSELEDLHDVAVVHLRGEPRFAEECLHEFLALGEVGEDLLHHQHLLEASRPLLLGQEHLAHTARGELLHEEILPEGGADVSRCGCFGHDGNPGS